MLRWPRPLDPLPTPDLFFLDERERGLVLAALDVARGRSPEQGERLDANLSRLARAADLIRNSPSTPQSWETSMSGAPDGSLLAQLCRVPIWDLDLNIPTKAVLGQAYLVAKINFFKAIAYTLQGVDGPADLVDRAYAEIAQSIYSKFAEELFLTIITDPTTAALVKRSAGRLMGSSVRRGSLRHERYGRRGCQRRRDRPVLDRHGDGEYDAREDGPDPVRPRIRRKQPAFRRVRKLP